MSRAEQPRTRRRWDMVRAVLAGGIAFGLGGVGTMASWTTGASLDPGALTSGQLDVVVNNQLATVAHVDGTYVEASWKVVDMMPSEYVALEITATNAGSSTMPLDLRVEGYATGTLGPHMAVAFYADAVAANTASFTSVGPSTWREGTCTGGTKLTNWVNLGSGPGAPATIIGTKQRLNVGESRHYCVQLALDGAATTYDNATLLNTLTTVVIVLRGTQVGAP